MLDEKGKQNKKISLNKRPCNVPTSVINIGQKSKLPNKTKKMRKKN